MTRVRAQSYHRKSNEDPLLIAARRDAVEAGRAAQVAASIAAETRARQARRYQAETGQLFDPTNDRSLSIGERMASALVETPSDLIAQVRRQWPELWMNVLDEARRDDALPGVTLMRVIARGLQRGEA